MKLQPKKVLTPAEVQRGLRSVIGDGLATEAMTTLTGGAFMVALALLVGANNFQIGVLAALPTFTNLFQLLSIWLVRRYNNRRALAVFSSLLARVPLLLIGLMALTAGDRSSADLLIFFLFFYYFFGSIAGPSWNSWMKDLVPQDQLGNYFSRRGSYMQMLNVVLSLSVAFLVDHIKNNYSGLQLTTYGAMYTLGGLIGLVGALILSRAPEPQSSLSRQNILRLLAQPLRNKNFRRLLMFNSAWVFALNIATPFFTVFMMRSMGLSLTFIIGLAILSQVFSILTIRIWGIFADRYSNKTIIAICAPLYILTILAWCFVGIYTTFAANIALLAVIHIFTGVTTSGINLSLTNIGLKLSPNEDAIVYLSARSIVTAFFSSLAPLVGGSLADFFTDRKLNLTLVWDGPSVERVFRVISLQEWNFLFLFGALLAFVALQLLPAVREKGEVEKDVVVRILRSTLRNNLKDYFLIGNLINWHEQLRSIIRKGIDEVFPKDEDDKKATNIR